MEQLLNDKLFQYFFTKTYGKKKTHLTFKTFEDKEKVSFLINLYLFTNSSEEKIATKINEALENEEKIFIKNNKEALLKNYNSILNKYKNSNIHFPETFEQYELIKEEGKELYSEKKHLLFTGKKNIDNNNFLRISKVNKLDESNNTSYFEIKDYGSNKNSDKNISISSEKKSDRNFLSNFKIESKKNDIDIDKNNIIKMAFYKKNNPKENNIIKKIKKNNTTNNKLMNPKGIIIQNLELNYNTLKHKKVFDEGDLVERLFKCPQGKYVFLNCEEANKIAEVIVSLMQNEEDFKNTIEDLQKKTDPGSFYKKLDTIQNEISNAILRQNEYLEYKKVYESFTIDYDKESQNIKEQLLEYMNKL